MYRSGLNTLCQEDNEKEGQHGGTGIRYNAEFLKSKKSKHQRDKRRQQTCFDECHGLQPEKIPKIQVQKSSRSDPNTPKMEKSAAFMKVVFC